ncbi:MAG: hydrolase, partial [Bacteroidales bacterium]|nr:hydrolase [Bacteroidales bacterium]
IGMTVSYNDISLPKPYNSAKLILAGPTLDITFTDKLFFTTFVQYNNQIDNLNMNIRFQWRFAPVSDLFIVYTGNSFTEHFGNKNRGLVVKLSYWFN